MRCRAKSLSGSIRDKKKGTRKQNKWDDPFFVQAVRWGTRRKKKGR